MSKVYDWFEERLEVQAIADDISSKYVPPHVNIFACFGGLVLTCFLIQVATGFAMTFYYRPSVVDAFASVEYIMTSVNFGWLIRSIHRWSASMMVLMLVLHVFRVYLTGGFKKPRELTWVTGVTLAVVTVSFGVTGYSLPWDQVGFWACKIVTGVPEAVPVIVGLVSDGVLNKFATVISLNALTLASLMMKLSSVAGAAPRSLAFDIVSTENAVTSLSISLIAPTSDVASIDEFNVAKSPISVADKLLKVVLNVSNVSVDATLLAVILLLYYLF